MISRGLCAGFNMFYPWSCYPEYFKRIPGIDSTKSFALFNELKSMNALSAKNYARLSPDQIILNVKAQPGKYPALLSLTPDQAEALDDLIKILLTFHHYHSHFNGKLLRFYNETCGKITTPYQDLSLQPSFSVFPNPTDRLLNIKLPDIKVQNLETRLFDLGGRLIWSQSSAMQKNELLRIDVKGAIPGLYLLGIRGDKGYINIQKVQIQK
jgi:hypothetical protein